jgi:hypothetical protein
MVAETPTIALMKTNQTPASETQMTHRVPL